jgi:hypothetical protein
MENFIRLALLVIAALVLPICYVWLCGVMRERGIVRPPRVAFFFLFGTVGGWVLAFMLSPSGLTATCIVLMMTAAPLALLLSSIYLAIRPESTPFHRVAMWCGFAYCAIPALGFITSMLFH